MTPRALGFEQILATDFNVDKFPAPGEWYISLSVADSESSPAEIPAELPIELEVTVEGTAQAVLGRLRLAASRRRRRSRRPPPSRPPSC